MQDIWEFSVIYSPFFYDSKTLLKNKVYIKNKMQTTSTVRQNIKHSKQSISEEFVLISDTSFRKYIPNSIEEIK